MAKGQGSSLACCLPRRAWAQRTILSQEHKFKEQSHWRCPQLCGPGISYSISPWLRVLIYKIVVTTRKPSSQGCWKDQQNRLSIHVWGTTDRHRSTMAALVPLAVAVIKYPDEKQLREEKVYLACDFRLQSIMARKSRQELKTLHIRS